jgi:predicted ATPase
MLTELKLSNFKSWRELDMKLGRVTGLFGTNSSGKSSILQFLLMLKQTNDSYDTNLILALSGKLVNLGTFKDLIFHHCEELSLDWRIFWKGDWYSDKVYSDGGSFIYKNNHIQEIRIRRIVTKEHFCSELDSIFYLAPLREYPSREYYEWSGASPSHVGYRGENTINAILVATIRNLTRTLPNSTEERPFQEVIAYWLKKLGLIHEFSVKEIAEGTGLFRAIVKKSPESPEAFLTDVGFGVSQILPVLVLLYYVPYGSIILMEQPEIHLHPSVQSGLADMILQVSKQRNLQVIVESHSEHLLRRFQRRIAEESYPADEIKLYFCDMQDGESKLIDLKINEYGEIENWPENFFGDEMAEIAAMRTAGLKRKIREAAKNGS